MRQGGWRINEVWKASGGSIIKIRFGSLEDTNRYLEGTYPLGNLRIRPDCKEREIFVRMNNCWRCGQFNPDHAERDCTRLKICVKCGSMDHQIRGCPMPRAESRMTMSDKRNRYCGHCRMKTDHTTLQNTKCPAKRNYRRKKEAEIRAERRGEENRTREEEERWRRIMNASNGGNTQRIITEGPKMKEATITIITVAILNEATNPGSFKNALNEGFRKNGMEEVDLDLKADCVKYFMDRWTG